MSAIQALLGLNSRQAQSGISIFTCFFLFHCFLHLPFRHYTMVMYVCMYAVKCNIYMWCLISMSVPGYWLNMCRHYCQKLCVYLLECCAVVHFILLSSYEKLVLTIAICNHLFIFLGNVSKYFSVYKYKYTHCFINISENTHYL